MNAQLGEGPTVNLMQSGGMEEHKSTITARKGAAKKPGVCSMIFILYACLLCLCISWGKKVDSELHGLKQTLLK